MNASFVVTTSATIPATKERIWESMTNAVMTRPKPWCFNMGVPLPQQCAITRIEDGIGKSRQCTSDHGCIQQEITRYEPYKALSFHMVSHDLRVMFAIIAMRDAIEIVPSHAGYHAVTRTTHVEISNGFGLWLRKWLVAQSIRNVHRYVYDHMASAGHSST